MVVADNYSVVFTYGLEPFLMCRRIGTPGSPKSARNRFIKYLEYDSGSLSPLFENKTKVGGRLPDWVI